MYKIHVKQPSEPRTGLVALVILLSLLLVGSLWLACRNARPLTCQDVTYVNNQFVCEISLNENPDHHGFHTTSGEGVKY